MFLVIAWSWLDVDLEIESKARCMAPTEFEVGGGAGRRIITVYNSTIYYHEWFDAIALDMN